MSNHVDKFVERNEQVVSFLVKIGKDYENADKNFILFKDFLISTNYNTTLGIGFANILQNLTSKDNFADYELGDISRLFSSLIKTQEFNIDTYLEAAHFEWAVMNNRQKATDIIIRGLTKATEKIDELKKLLDNIQKENCP